MADRFFVTVRAPSRAKLAELDELGLHVFHPTVREEGDDWSIQGLLTDDEREQLEDAGFDVSVDDPESARVRADLTMELDEWLQAIEEL